MTIRALVEEMIEDVQACAIELNGEVVMGTAKALSLMINDALNCSVSGISTKGAILWIYGTGVTDDAG